MEVSLEQPCGISRKGQLGQDKERGGIGRIGGVGGPSQTSLFEIYGRGEGSGHQTDYYDVRDQRFLGDERFVEQIDERIRAEREIEVPSPRAPFSKLLHLTAEVYGVTERDLVQAGRQRKCRERGQIFC